jgi:protein-tyrosine phosphatase
MDILNFAKYYYYYLYDTFWSVPIANRIINGLFLGDIIAGNNLQYLVENDITLVINLSDIVYIDTQRELSKHNIRFINISVRDHPDDAELLLSHMPELVNIIHTHIEDGKNVLVNCYAGRQRSATLVACYLTKHFHKTNNPILDSIDLIQSNRPIAFTPKTNFYNVIQQFYKSTFEEIVDVL